MKWPVRYNYSFLNLTAVGLIVAGCGGAGHLGTSRPQAPLDRSDQQRLSFGSLLDDGGWTLFGGNKKGKSEEAPSANPYLWRAGLESLRFLPLASADVRGGVVVSDWYTFPDRPGERFKISMFVKSTELRAEALEVTVHKQKGTHSAVVRDDVKAKEIEDIIIKRARSMYIESKQGRST